MGEESNQSEAKDGEQASKWGREQGYNKGWHATNCAGAAVCSHWVKFIFEMLKNSIVLKIPKYIILKLKILISTVSSLNATRHEKVQSRERF